MADSVAAKAGPVGEQPGNLKSAALQAEWNVPEGRIGDVIRQLRYRAWRARLNSLVFLGLLVVVVMAGLGLYIGPQFLTQYFDGRRATLTQTIADADAKSAELTATREALR